MKYTKETYYFDYSSPIIQSMIKDFSDLAPKEELIHKLYLTIRDNWRYTPFNIGLTKADFKASNIAKKPHGHCIDKAILFITCLRVFGIPARLHLAKVSNHIATERLEEIIGTNELTPHGLVDVYYNDKWVKCSPAFNKELCNHYNVKVLDFNGTEDAVLQEYNKDNDKFMTYLEDYGHFQDIPYDFIVENFKSNYPGFYEKFKGQDQIVIQ
jgi:transglutaminase-like putative cysteine protease